MDLTVAATPGFFGSMFAERRWLARRVARPELRAGQYEDRDTRANLAMGTASLLVPLVTHRLRRHVALGAGRAAAPLAVLAAGGVAVATGADRMARRQRARASARAETDSLDSLPAEQVAGIAAVVGIGAGVVVAASTWGHWLTAQRFWEHRIADLGDGVVGWAAALVGWDFIYYWNHRFMHESRFMWAIHDVHHSSQRYNLSVALRQPVADALGTFVPYGVLSLLGVRPDLILTSRGINLLYQYWIHTEAIRHIGPVEGILNSPADHRVHHGTAPESIDRNHGGILSIWDRLFGTYQPETEQQVYGLTTNLNGFSPVMIATHEYRDIIVDISTSRSWAERLSVVFKGPGFAIERRRQLAAA